MNWDHEANVKLIVSISHALSPTQEQLRSVAARMKTDHGLNVTVKAITY